MVRILLNKQEISMQKKREKMRKREKERETLKIIKIH